MMTYSQYIRHLQAGDDVLIYELALQSKPYTGRVIVADDQRLLVAAEGKPNVSFDARGASKQNHKLAPVDAWHRVAQLDHPPTRDEIEQIAEHCAPLNGEHTYGPWRSQRAADGRYQINNGYDSVATVYTFADAQLVAQAPSMLNLLKILASDSRLTNVSRQLIDEQIAKATSGEPALLAFS